MVRNSAVGSGPERRVALVQTVDLRRPIERIVLRAVAPVADLADPLRLLEPLILVGDLTRPALVAVDQQGQHGREGEDRQRAQRHRRDQHAGTAARRGQNFGFGHAIGGEQPDTRPAAGG